MPHTLADYLSIHASRRQHPSQRDRHGSGEDNLNAVNDVVGKPVEPLLALRRGAQPALARGGHERRQRRHQSAALVHLPQGLGLRVKGLV